MSDGLEDTVIPDHPRPKLNYPFEEGVKVGTDLQKAAGGLRDDVLTALTLDTSSQIQTTALAAPECAFLASS